MWVSLPTLFYHRIFVGRPSGARIWHILPEFEAASRIETDGLPDKRAMTRL